MTSTRFKRSVWSPGMVYGIPLQGGGFCYAQALSLSMTNVVDIALLQTRSHGEALPIPPFTRADVVAILGTRRQDLNGGRWNALGPANLVVDRLESSNQRLLASGTKVGIKCLDLGLVQRLADAWFGLAPWNVMFDERYFDGLLAPGVERPSSARLLTATERETYRAGTLAAGT